MSYKNFANFNTLNERLLDNHQAYLNSLALYEDIIVRLLDVFLFLVSDGQPSEAGV
jgi:hypothetical protein